MPANFTGGNRNNFVQRKPTLRKRKQAEYFAKHRTAPLAQSQLPSTSFRSASRPTRPTFNFAFARPSAPSRPYDPPPIDQHDYSAQVQTIPTRIRKSSISKYTHMDYAEKRRRLLATPDWAGFDIPAPRPTRQPVFKSPPRHHNSPSHDPSSRRFAFAPSTTTNGRGMDSSEILEFTSLVDSGDWILPPDSSLSPALSLRSLDANHSLTMIDSNFDFDFGSHSATPHELYPPHIAPPAPPHEVERPALPPDDSPQFQKSPPQVFPSMIAPSAYQYYTTLTSPTSLIISESIFRPQIVDWVGPASYSSLFVEGPLAGQGGEEERGRLFESRSLIAREVKEGLGERGMRADERMGLGYCGRESIAEVEVTLSEPWGVSDDASVNLVQGRADQNDKVEKANDHFKSTLLHLSTLSSPPAPSFDFQLSSQDFIPLPLASVPPSPHRLPSPSVSPPIAHDDTSDETPIIDILLPSLPLPPANDLRDAPSSTPSLSDYRSATKRAQEVNRTEEARISIDLFPHSEAEDLAVYSTQPGAQEKRDGGIADELGRNEGGEVDSGIIILDEVSPEIVGVGREGTDGMEKGAEGLKETFALRLFEDEKVEDFFDFD